MEEKFCNGCQKSKPKTSDYFGRKGKGWQAQCKECQNLYHKQHYQDNINQYKTRAKARNKKITEEVRKFIQDQKNVPCYDCHKRYPYYVMDFDHRDEEEKEFNIGNMARTKPKLEIVIKEIAKCDVVCANCHRERTHNRKEKTGNNVI